MSKVSDSNKFGESFNGYLSNRDSGVFQGSEMSNDSQRNRFIMNKMVPIEQLSNVDS